ncbi:MAG: hypothetical protein KHX31_10260 [Akkermansia sp.]|uniref:hypothetical protein n=1 Tax=Akkermansia sp. TaxID=1872421 RepID=UPI0025BC622A|nr:hypothetical protein [Akkermansia sp.]MBS5509006.1 hypothetical protein [Akkermansia sp.]
MSESPTWSGLPIRYALKTVHEFLHPQERRMGLRHFPHGLDASGSKGTAFNNATLPGTNSWFLEFMLDFRIGNPQNAHCPAKKGRTSGIKPISIL